VDTHELPHTYAEGPKRSRTDCAHVPFLIDGMSSFQHSMHADRLTITVTSSKQVEADMAVSRQSSIPLSGYPDIMPSPRSETIHASSGTGIGIPRTSQSALFHEDSRDISDSVHVLQIPVLAPLSRISGPLNHRSSVLLQHRTPQRLFRTGECGFRLAFRRVDYNPDQIGNKHPTGVGEWTATRASLLDCLRICTREYPLAFCLWYTFLIVMPPLHKFVPSGQCGQGSLF
jgi:hypothetical protein